MAKILVIHGAGMNMRGKVQTEIFGKMTLPEYDVHIRGYASELGVEIEIFHSNIEGEVINKLYEANDAGSMRRCSTRRVRTRLSGVGGGDLPGEVSHDRTAHLQSGAARPGVRDRNRESGHGHRIWHRRVLPGAARPARHAGEEDLTLRQ